jgi:hypothetical protein
LKSAKIFKITKKYHFQTNHTSNPSFEDFASLKKRFPLIDDGYRPVYEKPLPIDKDVDGRARLRKTLDEILSRYKDASKPTTLSCIHTP